MPPEMNDSQITVTDVVEIFNEFKVGQSVSIPCASNRHSRYEYVNCICASNRHSRYEYVDCIQSCLQPSTAELFQTQRVSYIFLSHYPLAAGTGGADKLITPLNLTDLEALGPSPVSLVPQWWPRLGLE